MKIVQVDLRSHKDELLTIWVDKRPHLKEGVYLTLKDFKQDTLWLVEKIYKNEHEAEDFDWHRKWDNNI